MPVQVSYPGVYVEEIPATTRTVAGVSTASTAFIDFFSRGPIDRAVRCNSFSDFERIFGGLHKRSEASYGLMQYFTNGGQVAWVVRVGDGTAEPARHEVPVITPSLAQIVAEAAQHAAAAARAAARAREAAEGAETALGAGDAGGLAGSTEAAADATVETAEATREAARAAHDASAGLQVAIQVAEASSGEGADRTKDAAQAAAGAATAAETAANAAGRMAQDAQTAAEAASRSLDAGKRAREARQGVQIAQGAQLAAAGQKDAETAAGKAADAAKKAGTGELADARKAASEAAEQAAAAGRAATAAAEAAHATAKVAGDAAAGRDVAVATAAAAAAAEQARVAAGAARGAADGAAAKQAGADAEAAAKAAAGAAKSAADTAAGLVPGSGAAAAREKAIVEEAKQAAGAKLEGAADLADAAAGVAEDAAEAIGAAAQAATDAAGSAVDAGEAATDAAQGAGSAEATLAAQEASYAAKQTTEATAAARQDAELIRGRVAQAAADARTAGDTARQAAAAAKDLPTALAAAKAAQEAADAGVAAARAVEGANLTAAALGSQAATAGSAAARGAQAAAEANRALAAPTRLLVEAANPGVWGNNLRLTVETTGATFSVNVQESVVRNNVARVVNDETFHNLTLEPESRRNAVQVVNAASKLVQLTYSGPQLDGAYPEEVPGLMLDGGDDGGLPDAEALTGSAVQQRLEKIAPEIFNLMCIPATSRFSDPEAQAAIAQAMSFCADKRAFLVVDVPQRIDSVERMQGWLAGLRNATAYHGAVYFPRLVIADPLDEYRPRNVPPSGAIAGVYARTDTQRGVWKAPAGIGAALEGANVAVKLTDQANGQLNPLGINVLRSFPVYGNIVWGARTMAGADPLTSEWKYVNVRRLANYIEESLYQSLKWAVFEPNDEPLWSQVRLQVGSFMAGLFADGAFQGSTPDKAYFVRCDATTTTQTDIELGIVNILVGFAPVKPAEFVVLQVQQMAGQAA